MVYTGRRVPGRADAGPTGPHSYQAPRVERLGRQRNLVLILARSFAAQLATAVFLVDAEGTVIYFNEAAERLLGQRFIEGAGMAPEEWSTRYRP